MKVPPQTVRVRGWRSMPDHDYVLDEGREVICPNCGVILVRYLSYAEQKGRAWPEETAHNDRMLLATHDCGAET